MRITILIPTYRRADDLTRCLDAIVRQQRPADQVVVVARPDDAASQAVIAAWSDRLPLTNVPIDRPGVVAAMNAGWAAADADVVALTDDDSAPHADWLARLEAGFAASPDRGALGGRDLIGGEVQRPGVACVGKLTWWGKMIGGHHLGEGEPRRVDFLKGVNMAVRKAAAPQPPFDETLRGQGAQVHWEIDLCLSLSAAGWSLVYDPAIRVDHHPAPRHDADQRATFNAGAEYDRVHNETMVLSRRLSTRRRWAYRVYMGLIGTRENVGLVQAVRLRVQGDPHAWTRFAAGQAGRVQGRKSAANLTMPPACVAPDTGHISNQSVRISRPLPSRGLRPAGVDPS